MIEKRKIDYLNPIRIVDCSNNINNKEALLDNHYDQVGFNHESIMRVNGKGYIVLDFGKELAGGIRILHNYEPRQRKEIKIRIRFGESLCECYSKIGHKNSMNSQSIRDVVLPLPTLSDFSFGDTGFRFVRIDFLDNKVYNIPNIYAKAYSNSLKEIGSFKCDDERVNRIYEMCKYTLSLCTQNRIWDGVKRDRLVWIGDMEPVAKAFLYTYGEQEVLKESLIQGEQEYPLPSWFGKIPSYNAWYIKLLTDYYFKTANKEFIIDRIPYINETLSQFDKVIDENGITDFSKVDIDFRGYFIDWPTFKNEQSKMAYSTLLLYIFKECKKLFDALKLDSALLEGLICKLEKCKVYDYSFKQLLAFNVLSGKDTSENAFNKLIEGNSKGMSSFLSYYELLAVARKDINKAIEMMKEYYGSEIDLGATTTFEEHDMEWVKNSAPIDKLPKKGEHDYHGDFGKECYKGYRESLCHGWAIGPLNFLIDEVVGFKVLEPGYKKFEIKPNLGNLNNIFLTVPTPFGKLEIIIEKINGKTIVKTKKIKEKK